jgi:RNA polymerase II subunit A small phosphatase-like protein
MLVDASSPIPPLRPAQIGPWDKHTEPFVPQSGKPILVLDLDETIVYSTSLKVARDSFPIKVGRYRMHVQVRPHAQAFVAALADHYDILVFTAASKEYTDQIVDAAFSFILRENRFYSDSCTNVNGYRVKDLSILGWPEQQIVLIDDMLGSGLMQPQNVFVVPAWMGDSDDNVFQNLLPLLVEAASVPNVVDRLKTALTTKNYTFVTFDNGEDTDTDEL